MRAKNKIFLIVILAIAAFLRMWQLGINPPHLTPDEAALGYNAFSILKTGRDEYGEFLPVIFKSFGDFKPGLYVYATVPFVALLELTELAVRLPSALAGVVAVWLVYKITLMLFAMKKNQHPIIGSQSLALISALFLAISPWHIHFSRGAWEINLSLTLTLAGIYLFLLASKKIRYLVPSALFFGLTLITYQGAKLSTLIVVILLGLVYWEVILFWLKDKKTQKWIGLAIVVGVIVALPILLSFTRGQTGRLKVFSVFSYRRPEEYLTEQLDLAEIEFGSPKYYLYYSEALNIARGIIGRWSNHFSGRFLFFEGDWQNPRHSSPDHGELLLVDMVFLLVGLFALIKTKSRGAKFVIAWLLLAPLPAALSRDQVHAVRSYNMVVPISVTVAMGATTAFGWLGRHRIWGKLGAVGLSGLYIASTVYFLDSYFVHQPVHDSQYWEYGYKQVVETVTPIQHDYHTVHVRQSFAQPYIYFLFYQQYDPAEYQKQANLIASEYGDVGRVEELDNIRFWPIDWTVNRGDFGTLFVADPIRIPPEDSSNQDEFKVIGEIKYLDGKETAFRIIEVLYKNSSDEKE